MATQAGCFTFAAMNLKQAIRLLKTAPLLRPVLLAIDGLLWLTDTLALVGNRRQPGTRPGLVVLKFDALGDYLMLRPYLRHLKEQPDYQPYSFCLCGNVAFRQLAEFADADLFDSFIWVDIYKLSTKPLYRWRVARQLRRRGFAVSLNPTYSRVLVLDDFLTRVAGAAVRLGAVADQTNSTPVEARWGNRYFTRLLPTTPAIVFEAERNRQLFGALLQTAVPLLPLSLPVGPEPRVALPSTYVILSPGAGAPDKIWHMARFATVLTTLNALRPDLPVVVTGTPAETALYDELKTYLPAGLPVVSLVGVLSQAELITAVARARLVLANDSGIVHMAAAVGTPCLSLSAGKSLVRWHPYPAGLAPMIQHVYPAYFDRWAGQFDRIAPDTAAEAPVPVDSLDTDRVATALRQLLRDTDQRFSTPSTVK